MTYTKEEKESRAITIHKDDIEAMRNKGWKVNNDEPNKIKPKKIIVDEFKQTIGDKDDGHTHLTPRVG